MILGSNFVGFERKAEGEQRLHSFSTLIRKDLPGELAVATDSEVQRAVDKATISFQSNRQTSFADRASFLDAISIT